MKWHMNETDTAPDEATDSFLSRSIARLRTRVRGPDGWKVIVWAGLIGMGLIFLSSFWSPSTNTAAETAEDFDAAAYTVELEQRLTDMLTHIEGVGDCQVMITLENARQYVYTDRHEVVTEIQPTVKGVIVVCTGADDETVTQRVQTAVQTVLHITAKRVCVTPSI